MSFQSRYFAYLLVVPVAIGLPMGLIFLSQVEQLSTGRWMGLVAIMSVLYAIGSTLFVQRLRPYLQDVRESVPKGGASASDALSRLLRRTTRYANVLWIVCGLAFAVLAAVLVGQDFWSIRHFLVASALAAGPACAWSYGASKHMLAQYAGSARHVRYTGRHRLTVTRKIAILFIGFFVISSVATVQLVSSRVAQTLERLAIDSAEDTFQTITAAAAAGASMADLQNAAPRGYVVFGIEPGGRIIGAQSVIDADDVANIRRIGNGDSSAFVSPRVMRFRRMQDGSIIGLRIPWDDFSRIPTQITLFTLLAAAITTVLFIFATIWFSRDIRQPLSELRRMAAELASGNFTVERHVFSDDDLGELSDSFAETRDNLRRLMSRIGGSGAVITEGVHVITGGTGALLERSRTQANLTAESTQSLEGFRGGIDSLVQSAQKVTAAADDTSSRAIELQASAEEIARSMDYLFQSVEKTSASTTEMNASATEMSRRTDVLANIGEDVLSFVAQMDSTVEELRQNSEATASISREVREAAVSGGSAVGEAVEGIDHSHRLAQESGRVLDELQSSVGQIDHILRVIEDVTEQTNLLALNASIIAAQAGEHGRSFNIVAGEIRQLAERTRGSTKQISAIIEAIRGSASDAVRSMQASVARAGKNVSVAKRAEESLQTILSSADRSHEMATRISKALGDQAQASRHLHEVTSRMSDHIAEINRSTREQARGTQLLAEEAERVREIALQVRTSTDEQSQASRGISSAMEQMAADAASITALLRQQVAQTERIAEASRAMLQIAQDNDAVAQEFNRTVETLVRSGDEFESEVGRFRLEN